MRISRLLAAHEIHEKNAQLIASIAREAEPSTPMRPSATPAGDERRLRGIPAIGRGVGGAIPGTRPGC